jgi:Ser/Thr protein kinase RdoA (MazF antagonist)
MVDQALDQLETTLTRVWEVTLRRKSVNAGFVDQALARLDEVFQVHPEFASASYEIGTLSVPSLEKLLARAREAEERFSAPFTVLVHGDLNADNIIINHRANRLHFVDLHRSSESDYVQDISILLVSNFRLPVFGGDIRGTLNHVVQRMYRFSRAFSEAQEDPTFDVRLALGLARALITSTRFEMDREFAQAMYSRSVYLLEKVVDLAPDKASDFRVSTDLLVY